MKCGDRILRRAVTRRVYLAVVPLLLIALFITGLPAAAASGIPKYAYMVAGSQKGAEVRWSVWLFGKNRSTQCWATKVSDGKGKSESVLCGFSVPERAWQLAAMGQLTVDPPRSFLFFLSRSTVAELRFKVRNGQQPAWHHVATEELTRQEAADARLPRSFHFAFTKIPGRSVRPEKVVPYFDCGDGSEGRLQRIALEMPSVQPGLARSTCR